jgi:hypothetical protein
MTRVLAAACLLLSAAAGCAPSGRQVTWVQIRGAVTCDGKPVAEGTVQFHDAKTGEAPQADLGPNGTYEVKLPAAGYAVCVVPLLVNQSSDGMPNWVAKKAADIPAKYQDPAKSGFTADVPADGSKSEFTFAMTKSK